MRQSTAPPQPRHSLDPDDADMTRARNTMGTSPHLLHQQAAVLASLDVIVADITDLIDTHPIAAAELPGLTDHIRRVRALLAVVDEEYADRGRTGRWTA